VQRKEKVMTTRAPCLVYSPSPSAGFIPGGAPAASLRTAAAVFARAYWAMPAWHVG